MIEEKINIAILIIDDDKEEHLLIEEAIKDAEAELNTTLNYTLHVSWEEFIKALTGGIDVCIIDHFISIGKTGLDILKEIKEKNKDSFAIALTGLRDDEKTSVIKEEYMNVGVTIRWVDKNKGNYIKLLTNFLIEGLGIATRKVEMFNKLNKIEEGLFNKYPDKKNDY